ncbi:hypothetical protein CODIS_04030 [Candidatus Thiodiazotropha endolucinida]|uniref:Uncharacterized protein n=1 Tax=Candidatus Thiodiazotropha endolucinida TaxID=1655433 RepID=A0A7Z1AHQ4_9GAMM|nr:hypothetical protein CODIS_04030 [Candidatus Thiodiazotropha endolucinida]
MPVHFYRRIYFSSLIDDHFKPKKDLNNTLLKLSSFSKKTIFELSYIFRH